LRELSLPDVLAADENVKLFIMTAFDIEDVIWGQKSYATLAAMTRAEQC
jgi:hypothetical protein